MSLSISAAPVVQPQNQDNTNVLEQPQAVQPAPAAPHPRPPASQTVSGSHSMASTISSYLNPDENPLARLNRTWRNAL